MKKLLFSLLIISLIIGGGVALAYDDGGRPNLKFSSGGTAADSLNILVLVRNPEVSAPTATFTGDLSKGDCVVWDCVSKDGVTVNVVTRGTSTDAVAGVVVSTKIPTDDNVGTYASDEIGRRNWGYIQIYGSCDTVNIDGGSATVGVNIMPSDRPRYATNATARGQTMGFSITASAQGKSGAFIRCM